MQNKVLTELCKYHEDWIRMAKALPGKRKQRLSDDISNELVQEMYVKLSKYLKDIDKILYGDEINTFYVYVTLRNLYFNTLKYNSRTIQYEDGEQIMKFDTNIPLEVDNSLELLKMEMEDRILKEIESWHPYDARVFKLVFLDQIGIRKLSRETQISLTSIFNTVKNGKEKLRLKFGNEYKNTLYGKY